MSPIIAFIYGVLAMGYATAAMFFWRFWRTTRDRLFVYFTVAFTLLAAERLIALVTLRTHEDAIWLYVIRLAAFGLLAAAIVYKNRR